MTSSSQSKYAMLDKWNAPKWTTSIHVFASRGHLGICDWTYIAPWPATSSSSLPFGRLSSSVIRSRLFPAAAVLRTMNWNIAPSCIYSKNWRKRCCYEVSHPFTWQLGLICVFTHKPLSLKLPRRLRRGILPFSRVLSGKHEIIFAYAEGTLHGIDFRDRLAGCSHLIKCWRV